MVKQIILHRTVQTLHGRMKCLCTVLICLMLSAPSFAHPTESALFILVPSRIQEITYYNSLDRASVLTEGYKTAAFTYNNAGDMVKMQESNNGYTVLTRYYFGNQYELDSTSAGIKERLYLGGDAYSAPMVLQRVNNGSWTAYNIGRDYLGSITHIASASGTLVAEYSYDPWGRLRSPSTLGIYTPGSEPELFLGRGFTGHEHLTWFGLINMNARLYDPLLGRFLSPDPYVQTPDFTQNFNRYSYALNNPLRYSDESGYYWNYVIGALIGGVANVLTNWSVIEQKGFLTGLGYFAVGAAIGALSAGGAAWTASLTQAAGVGAGVLIGAGTGALIGGTGNYLQNGFNNLLSEGGFNDNWKSSVLTGVISGAICGAISGGVNGYKYAKEHGADPWSRNYIDPSEEGMYSDHIKETYAATSEKTTVLQPDKTKHCYAYVDAYADQGHFNHPAEDFIKATGGKDGFDPMKSYNIVNGTGGEMRLVHGSQWRSVGYMLSHNAEVLSTTNHHTINVRAITIGYKLHMFGGGIGNKLHLFKAFVHDPLCGYRYYSYLDYIGVIKY